MQEMQVGSLSQEDPLEQEMATQSSCLENPWTEEPGGLQFMRSQSDTTQHEKKESITHTSYQLKTLRCTSFHTIHVKIIFFPSVGPIKFLPLAYFKKLCKLLGCIFYLSFSTAGLSAGTHSIKPLRVTSE